MKTPVCQKSFWSPPLNDNALCAEARQRTKCADFNDPFLESRLSLLVRSLECHANLHPLGRMLARIHLRDLLQTRLRLEAHWKKSGGIESEPISRPIFITGMPRSGSTFLHELLTQDSAHRAPRVWEVMSPLPASVRRRIWSAAASLWWFRRFAPGADSVYPLRATMPHECVAIQSYTLLSREFTSTFRIPAYELFLSLADFTPAYVWQKRFLQHLQWQQPAKRWVLKAPDHVFSLEALLRVFPDALVIQTHRNPLEVLESSSRLTDVLQRMFARPQDPRAIGRKEARVLAEGMEHITRFREGHPEFADRFADVHYDELVSNPSRTVCRLYQQLDLPLTDAALGRVERLAASRARYRRSPARRALADLGIDSENETQRFADYCARFGVKGHA